jgi:PHS family inorganic phosphate transporter-like MFS transporter
MLGQLIFGFLSDKYGRRKLYGLELIVVIFGTLGLVQSSAGFNGSMDIIGWIMFWRFFVVSASRIFTFNTSNRADSCQGLGIGAEYPLSAVITAEFAPRRSRARMMASVFLMQPVGQLLASVVGLAVLITVGKNNGLPGLTKDSDHLAAATIVDRIWRYVIGVGAIPALIAIFFRLTIPESPRYTLDVDNDGSRALRDTQIYYSIQPRASNGPVAPYLDDVEGHGSLTRITRAALPHDDMPADDDDDDDDSMEIQELGGGETHDGAAREGDEALPNPFSWPELKRFFWTEGNITYLLGTSLTWFLLDFAFYGLGINNPRVLAQIWASRPLTDMQKAANTPDWANPSDPDMSIYETLKQDGIRSIITTSVGSMLGSIILIKAINYVPRKALLTWSFIAMAVLFAITGGSYFKAANTDLHALTIVLYVFCQLLFNLGPNTLTFIIPAEIFPTRYRGTCHGISAAAGKLGSIVVQAFLPYTRITNPNSLNLGWILIGFSFAMALGAVFSWAWIPELQYARGTNVHEARGKRSRFSAYEVPSKTLEDLAVGKAGHGDDVGFRRLGRRRRNKA